MAEKMALSVVCGGQSTEHDISIQSARNIVSRLDPNRYTISVIYIDPRGLWHWIPNTDHFLQSKLPVLDGTQGFT